MSATQMERPETPMSKLKADLRRYALRERRPVSLSFTLRMILLTPGFQFVLSRRLQEMAVKIPLVGRLLRRILWWGSCVTFGSELAMAAEVGGGFYIPHPFGIVIGAAKIGKDVTILQNVTLGKKDFDGAGDPVIEDGVYIAAGAVIVGAITVGRNGSVGANSVVLRDVPEGATAVGIPARIIPAKPAIAPDADVGSDAEPEKGSAFG